MIVLSGKTSRPHFNHEMNTPPVRPTRLAMLINIAVWRKPEQRRDTGHDQHADRQDSE